MSADALHIVNNSLPLIGNSKPLDKLTSTGTWAFANILKSPGSKRSGLETICQQSPNHAVGKELHAAVGVMNDEKFLRPKKLVADHQRTDRIVTGAATSIANHMSIALCETGIF